MKTALGLALLAVASFAHGASSTDSLLLAQVQKQARKQSPAQTQSQQQNPSCNRDGNAVGDRETWCRRGSVHQCNASTGQWINMGKKCP